MNLKIIYVVETFTEGLGYIDNILPRELSLLGHEVHVITCDLPMYYNVGQACFGSVNKALDRAGSIQKLNGFTIHWQPYKLLKNRVVISGLQKKIIGIQPNVVLVRGLSSFVMGQVITAKAFCRFKVFSSTGQAYSNVPKNLLNGSPFNLSRIKHFITRFIPGRLFSLFCEKCIGSTNDCVDCAVDFNGVLRKKTHVISLGVDTELFYPSNNRLFDPEIKEVRSKLELPLETVLCIWTGRLIKGKAAWVLAEAVDEMCRRGYNFYALFIGDGPDKSSISSYKNSTLLPFMKWDELPPYYRASDIVVWPRLITTSTLDASACGLPIIMSNKELASERWDGIGLTYKECDVQSLVDKLILLANSEYRQKLGLAGANKMKDEFSWNLIANKFVDLFNR